MMLKIWLSTAAPGHCTLDSADVPFINEFEAGVSVANKFPSNMSYQMSELFPDDILLSDNFNVSGQIVISGRLKTYIVGALPDHSIEFLPVSIINHKGRVAATDYFILHSLGLVDCINIEESAVTWNPLDEKIIMECEGLVIDENRIPTNVKIFRPLHWGSETMVLPKFADELKAAGFTGLRFIPANGYTGIG